MCRYRQKSYGCLRHLSYEEDYTVSLFPSWRPLLQLNPSSSACNRVWCNRKWCNSTGTVGASAISAFVFSPRPVPRFVFLRRVNKDVSLNGGESNGQQNGSFIPFYSNKAKLSSSQTVVIVGKLRGCCLLLLQLSKGRLQLLDQYSLLEPAREAKEVRERKGNKGSKLPKTYQMLQTFYIYSRFDETFLYSGHFVLS